MSLTSRIWLLLQSDAAIQKDLRRKLINVRALAKHLIRTYQLNASLNAVVSAIRRFLASRERLEKEKSILNVFADAIIETKNSISCLAIKKGAWNGLLKLGKSINKLKLLAGNDDIKIFGEKRTIERLKELFRRQAVIDKIDELSEIYIKLRSEARKTKGVLAKIANELSMADINIWECLITPPEIFVYIKQKDIIKAHESLLNLVNGATRK